MQATAQQLADRLGRRGRESVGVGRPRQHLGQGLGHGRRVEQACPAQHLVEHHSERPDVGALVDRHALRLLGRHVRRRAENHPHLRRAERQSRRRRELRRRAHSRRLHRLRQAEIQDFDFPIDRSLDVLRFQVSVDDSLLVRFFQCLRNLKRDGQSFIEGQRPGFETFRQRRPQHELHDQRARSLGLLQAEDRSDVRVLELGEQLCFALEARQTLSILGEGGRQDLDRDVALELRVRRAVDLAHPAFAQLGGDLVGTEARFIQAKPCRSRSGISRRSSTGARRLR